MIDAHQDVFARKICGEGIPNFYANQILDGGPTYCIDPRFDFILEPILKIFGYCRPLSDYDLSMDQDGNPKISDCQKYDFIQFFTSPEARTIQRAVYNNDFGMRDKFVASWKYVASKLSSNEHILAYDPLNEPEPTSRTIFEWMWNWLPGHLDRSMIAPFYSKIFKAYSQVDSESIMAFEPSPLPPDIVANVGFDKPPGGEIGSTHHIMNEHTYCCGAFSSVCNEETTGWRSWVEVPFWNQFCN